MYCSLQPFQCLSTKPAVFSDQSCAHSGYNSHTETIQSKFITTLLQLLHSTLNVHLQLELECLNSSALTENCCLKYWLKQTLLGELLVQIIFFRSVNVYFEKDH